MPGIRECRVAGTASPVRIEFERDRCRFPVLKELSRGPIVRRFYKWKLLLHAFDVEFDINGEAVVSAMSLAVRFYLKFEFTRCLY